ncbi:hypothetical protein I3760_14G098700 [Carya illinoinensis]|nr:hypothetical protein I3760_14G098700 [Carya illinoinensis]
MTSVSLVSAAARRLEGKVAVITSGASGIGEFAVRLFFKHGAKVVIADIQDDWETDVENTINFAVSKFGKLDIMINNAGVAGVAKPNILDNTKAEFEEVIGVNLVGAFLGTKHAARVMVPARHGSIITTASVCSIIGGHGVVGLMRNTIVELGQFGIRVNCVSPYLVATPLAKDFLKLDDNGVYSVYSNLKGSLLKPEDVAEALLYLGSDESKYVSGHNLLLDGGFTIVNPGFSMFVPS